MSEEWKPADDVRIAVGRGWQRTERKERAMSATPWGIGHWWKSTGEDVEGIVDALGIPVAEFLDDNEREEALRAVNAFDALLAVAHHSGGTGTVFNAHTQTAKTVCAVCFIEVPNHTAGCVIGALDAIHPGWRDWPTSSPSAR